MTIARKMGSGTMMPIFGVGLLAWIEIGITAVFMAADYDKAWRRFSVIPGLTALAIFWLGSIVTRTRLLAGPGGIDVRTQPFPVPGFPWRRTIPTRDLAGVYIAPRALTNKYCATFHRTYEIYALTNTGEPIRLLARMRELKEAEALLAEIRQAVGTFPATRTQIASGAQQVAEDPNGMWNWAAYALAGGLIFMGLSPLIAPYVRTAGMQQTSATITRALYVGVKHRHLECSVTYEAGGYLQKAVIREGCPDDAHRGDLVPVYYEPSKPNEPVTRYHIPLIITGMFSGLGVAWMVGLVIFNRREPKGAFYDDRFRSLSNFWDLVSTEASVSDGVLTIQPADKTFFLPNFQKAYGSAVVVEAEMKPTTGAGICFWVTPSGAGYVFAVYPSQRMAAVYRAERGGYTTVIAPYPLPAISVSNHLAVKLVDRTATFFVNDTPAGELHAEPPFGAGLAGLYAQGPCQVTRFRVYGL